MRFRLSSLKASHLLASWCVYWVGIALWSIGPALPILWRVTRPDAHGNASVNFGDDGFRATITEGAKTVWNGAITFNRLVLVMALPPLALWALWLWAQRGRTHQSPDRLGDGDAAAIGVSERDNSRVDSSTRD